MKPYIAALFLALAVTPVNAAVPIKLSPLKATGFASNAVYLLMMSNGFEAVKVFRNGRVICYHITEADLKELAGASGVYFALCAHRRRVNNPNRVTLVPNKPDTKAGFEKSSLHEARCQVFNSDNNNSLDSSSKNCPSPARKSP